MKQIINALACISGYFRHGSFFLLVFLVLSLSSCFRGYYQTNTVHGTDSAVLASLQKKTNILLFLPSGLRFEKDLSSVKVSGRRIFKCQKPSCSLEKEKSMSKPEKKSLRKFICT
jgi:hypothetical protein